MSPLESLILSTSNLTDNPLMTNSFLLKNLDLKILESPSAVNFFYTTGQQRYFYLEYIIFEK